ncbi:hypothetical protein CAEBREN_14044 [Caenorhabditis brenneri]|uniref:Uncharacterized protein n=1 Tax=Caenorhabditis brenneri TaxID=135651 RepID=G0MCT9_CAEBE|nr:hypothetical protein CAEBREN_14044 [Caenorhabditis brenneri]
MHLILLSFPIPLIHNFPWIFRGMQFSYLKTAKINFSDKLYMLFFYLLILVFIFYTFQIDLGTWDKKRRPGNFNFVRGIFVFSIPLSIPILYQAVLAWNTKKLMFKGLHPTTRREWEGVMKKNKDGEWEVDLEPEEHELVDVSVL